MMTKNKSRARMGMSALACATSLSVAACGTELERQYADGREQEGDQGSPSALLAQHGHELVQVTANGTGCPAGTWSAEVAPDGRSFTLALSHYAAELTAESAVAVRDCQLAVKLRGDMSYAIESLAYDGQAVLSEGVRGTASAEYYFQGAPTDAVVAASQLSGPYSGPYHVQHAVSAEQRRWSTCGVQRNLNIRTRLTLQNGSPRATGSLRVASIAGAVPGGAPTAGIRFSVRPCDGTSPSLTEPASPAAATGAGAADAEAERSGDPGIVSVARAEPSAPSDLAISSVAARSELGVGPAGLTITSVTAAGTGCPVATWSAERAGAGSESIQLRFDAYSAELEPGASIAVRDCQLAVKVASPRGLSYSLSALSLAGRASLAAGADAQLTASYYFQGDPSANTQSARTFEGPSASDYAVRAEFAPEGAVWSACDTQRDLNVTTRVRLTGDASTAASVFDVAHVTGLQFAVRPCAAN